MINTKKKSNSFVIYISSAIIAYYILISIWPLFYNIYLSFGMPYKHIIMLYGVPGSGKTSTITAIASHFDCDIYTIPITKELTDYGLIDAFSYINDKEDKKRIIVLEDIDCMFDGERKEGDDNNMITLQALLNCLDGHTCVEGTLLFMTANNPDKSRSYLYLTRAKYTADQ